MEIVFFYTDTMLAPDRIRESLRRMRDAGAGAVIVNVYEQDLLRWKKDMPRFFDLAAEQGLRRYISYGRHGGVFSGGLLVPSLFAYLHPETLVVPEGGGRGSGGEADVAMGQFFERICCVNHPAFRRYMEEQTKEMLERFAPDGLLFDEPKGLGLPCACPHCLGRRSPGEGAAEANLRFQVDFIRFLSDLAKSLRRDLTTMLVVGHHDDVHLGAFAAVPNLDVLGIEAYWIARGKDLSWLRAWCGPAIRALVSHGKRTQLWANNWGMPEGKEADLPEAYRIMAEAGPDQLVSFWWWRNSDRPEEVMKQTVGGIRALGPTPR